MKKKNKMRKELICSLIGLFLATVFSSCLNNDSDYDYYRKLLDDGNEKYECFATICAQRTSSGEVVKYWFDYNGFTYTPADSPIKEQYTPQDAYGTPLEGCRAYLVFEAADKDMNKDKEITLVAVRNIPTEDVKPVSTFADADYYGNDPLAINTYNVSSDGKYLDLVLTIKGTAVSKLNLLFNQEAQNESSVNAVFDLKHDRTQGPDENAEWITFISFIIPDDMNPRLTGKDNLLLNYTDETGSAKQLIIPTL